jgi:hypothetical protein
MAKVLNIEGLQRKTNFVTYPSPVFNKMNLREDTYVASTVLLPMYDRGLT